MHSLKQSWAEQFTPTTTQHYLLKAATAEAGEALHYWSLLKEHLGITHVNAQNAKITLLAELYDRLDAGSKRLLPMVYKNLQKLDDPLLQSIKSFYHYTWAQNCYAFEKIKSLAKHWVKEGVETTLLKGLAVAFFYAKDPGIRPMEDMDILVNPKFKKRVQQALFQQYQLKYPASLFNHSMVVVMDGRELDFHWRLFSEPGPDKWNIYKESNFTCSLDAANGIKVLDPTYCVFHILMHGIRSNFIAPIRWISDCAIIQRQHTIDWDKILKLFIEVNCIDRLHFAVTILPKYGVVIPQQVLDKIEQTPVKKKLLKYRSTARTVSVKECGFAHAISQDVRNFYWFHQCYREGLLSFSVQFPLYAVKRIGQYISKQTVYVE